jgi:hypothetical protein
MYAIKAENVSYLTSAGQIDLFDQCWSNKKSARILNPYRVVTPLKSGAPQVDYFSTLGAPKHRSLAEALGPQPSLAYRVTLTDKGLGVHTGLEVSLPTRSK